MIEFESHKPHKDLIAEQASANLNGDTLFSRFVEAGKKTALLNVYPPR